MFPAPADWYSWLSDAEAHWVPLLAAEYPYFMFGPPTLMTTADGGITFQFPGESAPLAVEVYFSLTGDRMTAGQYASGADYTWEGSQIRMPYNQPQSFSNGAPYARWVASPQAISATVQPTMLPLYTRVLLVDRALIYWATRGGMRDPTPFQQREAQSWAKIEESLKNSNPFYGDAANRGGSTRGISYLINRSVYR